MLFLKAEFMNQISSLSFSMTTTGLQNQYSPHTELNKFYEITKK